MRLRVKMDGDFRETKTYLAELKEKIKIKNLESYAQEMISALRSATPVDSGLTAESWSYKIVRGKTFHKIVIINTNDVGVQTPLAIMLQYGHGTKNGGWVQGRDYIDSTIQPIFDDIAERAWREVTSI